MSDFDKAVFDAVLCSDPIEDRGKYLFIALPFRELDAVISKDPVMLIAAAQNGAGTGF